MPFHKNGKRDALIVLVASVLILAAIATLSLLAR